jgi:protocatechuate 3,4-dioxygenase beta subunit
MGSNPTANRRRFLRAWGAASAGLALSPWLGARAEELAATRACFNGDDSTPRQMEGPYFKPRSPERGSLLEAGIGGTRIAVTGVVLSTRCKPVAGALLDFWQCDERGDYDNSGFRLRGHQFTDADGRYRLETIVPGLYPGRTRHIHVKVQAPSRPVLTTQLYFPGEPHNQDDFLFRPELLLALDDEGGPKLGRFDFVVKIA